ncbi:hypothetical protein DBB34_07940 [Sphaerisporangium cinnabarinum]|nr:hypothetical protein [Sphaerisporangium cinnabarinum]PTU56710.1 hypothetical protein DBB34_07940 [Sphaerisporangium cinnabarinum]
MEAEWVAVGISVLALGTSLASLKYGRGQRDAAVDQARAAEAQVRYAKRQVEVMEEDRRDARRTASETAVQEKAQRRRVPPWDLTTARGVRRVLTNGSDEATFDVVIDAADDVLLRGAGPWERIGPREAREFSFSGFAQTTSKELTVRWRWEPDGEVQTWTAPHPR